MSQITLRVFAGLGNQQFQYAFAKALSLKYQKDLVLDRSYFLHRYHPIKMQGFYYPYKLDKFDLDERETFGIAKEMVGLLCYFNKAQKIYQIVQRLPFLNKFPNINYITEILKNSETSSYWTKKFNTSLNITNKFINRGFNLSLNQRINDKKIKEVLNDINKMPKEGDAYLNYIYRKAVYVDISSIIKKNGYSLYKIDDNINLTKSDISYLLKTITSQYEFYNLTMSLLISKDYCHYVLNDPEYMHKLMNWESSYDTNVINLFNKYIIA